MLPVALWSPFSQTWSSLCAGVSFRASGGASVASPAQASVLLPLVIGLVIAMPLPMPQRLRFAGLAVACTLGAELVLLVGGGVLGLPIDAMQAARGVAEYVVPACVLALAMSASRS